MTESPSTSLFSAVRKELGLSLSQVKSDAWAIIFAGVVAGSVLGALQFALEIPTGFEYGVLPAAFYALGVSYSGVVLVAPLVYAVQLRALGRSLAGLVVPIVAGSLPLAIIGEATDDFARYSLGYGPTYQNPPTWIEATANSLFSILTEASVGVALIALFALLIASFHASLTE